MVAWTALQWWCAKLDAQGAENVNGGVAVLMVVDGDGVKRAIYGGVSSVNEEDDGEKMEVLCRGGSAGDGGHFLCCCCAERDCREEDELAL